MPQVGQACPVSSRIGQVAPSKARKQKYNAAASSATACVRRIRKNSALRQKQFNFFKVDRADPF